MEILLFQNIFILQTEIKREFLIKSSLDKTVKLESRMQP